MNSNGGSDACNPDETLSEVSIQVDSPRIVDQLCKEEEKVMISVSCCKKEKISHPNPNANSDGGGGGITFEMEDELTGQWSRQIRPSKDIFQFDCEDMKMLTRDTTRSLC